MLWRIDNPKSKCYHNYGGRGITVCPEWRDYVTFARWARENGYDDSLTIDRRDNSLGYSPANCRWTTQKVQSRNRRGNVIVEAFGESKTLVEWCEDERCPVKYHTLYARIVTRGESPEQAITTCVPDRRR
jgi:hypothetical protein